MNETGRAGWFPRHRCSDARTGTGRRAECPGDEGWPPFFKKKQRDSFCMPAARCKYSDPPEALNLLRLR
jgi:hypothetical protein